MDKKDIILLILAVALVIGMLLTAIFGRGTRHGYGSILPPADTINIVRN